MFDKDEKYKKLDARIWKLELDKDLDNSKLYIKSFNTRLGKQWDVIQALLDHLGLEYIEGGVVREIKGKNER